MFNEIQPIKEQSPAFHHQTLGLVTSLDFSQPRSCNYKQNPNAIVKGNTRIND
jgi:hypothetical protein